MNKLRVLSYGMFLLVVALCLLQKSTEVEGAYIPSESPLSSHAEDSHAASEPYESEKEVGAESWSTTSEGNDVRDVVLRDSNEPEPERVANDSKRNMEDKFRELFNPFLAFPFFPFHFPSLKEDIFHLNSTERSLRIEDTKAVGNRSERKAKPFFFIDFAFNIREIPLRNSTNELRSSRGDNAPMIYPRKNVEKLERPSSSDRSQNVDLPVDILDDDLSFFDDSPLMPPETDEFLPKSDFLFFDFPFHRKQSKKLVRNKRDMKKPSVKSDLNFIMDIFDEAISRTKKEMEGSVPLWDLMSDARKGPEEERDRGVPSDRFHHGDNRKLQARVAETPWNERVGGKGMKRSPYGSVHHKNPLILEKVVKIGKIHIGDDYAKNKKKRRNASVVGKKGNRGIHETSIELVQMDEPLKSELTSKHLAFPRVHTNIKDIFHKIHRQNVQEKEHKESEGQPDSGTAGGRTGDAASILELLNNWDGREVEEQLRTGKMVKIHAKKDSEVQESHPRLNEESDGVVVGTQRSKQEEGFEQVGHSANGRAAMQDDVGFEVLKPHVSFARQKRERGEGGQESEAESKDEVKRNITQVLGQFFSMMRKLGDSRSFYQDKESSETEGINWPELDEVRGPDGYSKGALGGVRKARESQPEEKNRQVADLNYLFLTVTLPTMIAFTLLVVVCFFNLRVRGWLCTKLFQPRHVYVVEADVEKGKQTQKIVEFDSEECDELYQSEGVPTKKPVVSDKKV